MRLYRVDDYIFKEPYRYLRLQFQLRFPFLHAVASNCIQSNAMLLFVISTDPGP